MENSAVDDVSSVLLVLLRERFGRGLISVVMFGSRVKGDYRPSSDYDFLVVCQDLPDPIAAGDLVAAVVSEVLFKTGRRVSLLLFSRSQLLEEVKLGSPLLLSMLTGYRFLCDRGKFVARALEALKGETSMIYKERGRSWVLRRVV